MIWVATNSVAGLAGEVTLDDDGDVGLEQLGRCTGGVDEDLLAPAGHPEGRPVGGAIDRVGFDHSLKAKGLRAELGARVHRLVDGLEVVERVQQALAQQSQHGESEHGQHADRTPPSAALGRGRGDGSEIEVVSVRHDVLATR